MREVYRSKIGKEIVIPIVAIIGGVLIFMIVVKAWAGILVILLVSAFILHLFATTYYTITGDVLNVRSGLIIDTNIEIGKITKITATRNMLSSPALSLDRLEISYNKYDSVQISPKDKELFIQALKNINNRIVCEL